MTGRATIRWSSHAGVHPNRLKAKPLGRREPTDWEHVAKYPLGVLAEEEQPRGVPVVIGINWYTDFDNPVRVDRRWWIGLDSTKLGEVRGGHCVCVKDGDHTDRRSWYAFYNQGREGACVGFGSSRAMSLLNGVRYHARWLWDHAKLIDEWGDTNPGDDNGTSVRAGMDVLRTLGHVKWSAGMDNLTVAERDALTARPEAGITANRWAESVDDVLRVLNSKLATRLGALPILNSWGEDYPRVVWMTGETADRVLFREDGEVAVPTDR